MILYLPTTSSMGDDHRWMYDVWKRSGAHIDELFLAEKENVQNNLNFKGTKQRYFWR
jgi:hypothetical protein